jgi:hypothetical protein
MASKRNSAAAEEPAQVFRQFAWHLAGSLANGKPSTPRKGAASRPAKAAGRR